MRSVYYHYVSSPVGPFLVAGTDEALCYTGFTSGHQQRQPKKDWIEDAGPIEYAVAQFNAYFDGDPPKFDIPLSTNGTAFQERVWGALREIPFGETRSYGEIARDIGRPNASRAVGAANRANHLPIIIPCHRVIGANGSLTGFGGGLDTKQTLLRHEGAGEQSQLQLL